MRPYEVVLILEADADDATVDGAVTRLKDLVGTKGGTTGQVEKWGRRRFAYELKHRHEGYYALVEMTVDPAAIADIDRMLTLSDDIVRHKIIRIPESVAGRARPALNTEATEATEEAAESIGAAS
jgi:small subunit ribosomal protein S6